jgi:hypothetical protein
VRFASRYHVESPPTLSPGARHRIPIRASFGYLPNSAELVVGRARTLKPDLASTVPRTGSEDPLPPAWRATVPVRTAPVTPWTAVAAPANSHVRPRLTAPRTSDVPTDLRISNHHAFRWASAIKGDVMRKAHMPERLLL